MNTKMIIKVQNKDGVIGGVKVIDRANPKTYLMDFQIDNGDFWPEFREDLTYIKVEEL